ncbi:MAG: DUF4468 domain-containing protein [Janthinobacterium lividum]
MKIPFLLGALLLSLAAGAQRLPATLPPITYHVGPEKAPLFRSDTLARPDLFIPSYGEAEVVGRYTPRWVVVKRAGFLYLTPIRALSDYDANDAAPLPLDPQTHLITYEGVVPVAGVNQADLYARARAWVAKEYPPADVQFEQQDAATGQLVLKGQRPAAVHLPYNGMARLTTAGVIHHTLAIYLKDGRYKYVLTDLTHDASGVRLMKSGGPLEQDNASLFGYLGLGSHDAWTDLRVEATRDARRILDELQAALTLQPVRKAKDPRDF